MTTSKTQFVRLLDVFVFGPLMIAAGHDHKSAYFSNALMLVGVGTIVYNGINFLQNEASGELGCCDSCNPKRPQY